MTRIASASVRRLWLMGFVLLLMAIGVTTIRHAISNDSHVGSLTVVSQVLAFEGPGAIDENTASASAQKKLHELRPDLTAVTFAHGRHFSGVVRIDSLSGQALYTNTAGVNAWVFEIAGPGQQGFARTAGYAVVDSGTGDVKALSILLSN